MLLEPIKQVIKTHQSKKIYLIVLINIFVLVGVNQRNNGLKTTLWLIEQYLYIDKIKMSTTNKSQHHHDGDINNKNRNDDNENLLTLTDKTTKTITPSSSTLNETINDTIIIISDIITIISDTITMLNDTITMLNVRIKLNNTKLKELNDEIKKNEDICNENNIMKETQKRNEEMCKNTEEKICSKSANIVNPYEMMRMTCIIC